MNLMAVEGGYLHIDTMAPDRAAYLERRAALQELQELLAGPPGRPCRGCVKLCPCSGSTTCACHCSVECPDAPQALSSDPEGYPIESDILPLVFALARVDGVSPCWSCEGHCSQHRGLTRLPQVWFQTRILPLVSLVDDCLQGGLAAGELSTRWHVRAVTTGDRVDSAFCIEPCLQGSEAVLHDLQADARAVAKRINLDLPRLVGEYISGLDAALARSF